MNDRFSKFWSIDEMKSSVLVFVLIGMVGIGSFVAVKHGDIPQNMANVIIALVMVIGGVNAVGYFGQMSMNKSTNPNQQMQLPMQNQYGSQYSQYGSSYSPYGNSSMGMNGMGMGMNTMPMNNSIMPNSTVNSMGQPIGQPIISTPATTSTAANMQRPI